MPTISKIAGYNVTGEIIVIGAIALFFTLLFSLWWREICLYRPHQRASAALCFGWISLLAAVGMSLAFVLALWTTNRSTESIGILAALLLSAILMFFVGRRSLRLGRSLRQLDRPDVCSNCGYNLTGNESGTCPECGTEVKQ